MKAIAMKCSQKDWDSVKGLVKGIMINSFDCSDYLVTNYKDSLGEVTNLNSQTLKDFNRTVYETFDKDILFDALDIEFEKVWNSSEMQYYHNNEWIDSFSPCKYRFKPKNKELDLLKEQPLKLGYKLEKL